MNEINIFIGGVVILLCLCFPLLILNSGNGGIISSNPPLRRFPKQKNMKKDNGLLGTTKYNRDVKYKDLSIIGRGVYGLLESKAYDGSQTKVYLSHIIETYMKDNLLGEYLIHKDCGSVSKKGFYDEDEDGFILYDYLCPECNVTFLDNKEQTIIS